MLKFETAGVCPSKTTTVNVLHFNFSNFDIRISNFSFVPRSAGTPG
jgi:hypothetical protein